MVDYLESIDEKHTVIYNHENNGFEGFNPGLALVEEEFFILSDPDIILNPSMPAHWILRFVEVMRMVMTPKLGVALDISVLNANDKFQALVKERETEYWEHAGTIDIPCIKSPCYLAPVDTTLAMYRRDTYKFWIDRNLHFNRGDGIDPQKQVPQSEHNEKYYIPPIRVAGDYTCQHTGWVMPVKYRDDFEYYKNHCDLDIASTTKWQTSGRRVDE